MDRLTKIGDVRAKSAREVKTSRLGIGFEKLDRAGADKIVAEAQKQFDAWRAKNK